MKVGGIVLCGGQSRRMGSPKAWLLFSGETLLARIVRLLGEVVQPIVVVAAADQNVPTLPSEVLLARDAAEARGPLQGLVAGLTALDGLADAAYVTGCDTPFLQPAFVRRLIDLIGDHAICVPNTEGRFHPLAAVYRLKVRATVEKLLAEDRLRTMNLFDEVPTRVVGENELIDVDEGLLTLRNLNTPEDYQAAVNSTEGAKHISPGQRPG